MGGTEEKNERYKLNPRKNNVGVEHGGGERTTEGSVRDTLPVEAKR